MASEMQPEMVDLSETKEESNELEKSFLPEEEIETAQVQKEKLKLPVWKE